MNYSRQVLVLIVAAGMAGSVHAEPVTAGGSMAPLRNLPYSFADLYRLSVDTAAPAGVAVAQHAVVQFTGPILRSETGARRTPEGMLLPVDVVPKPTGWMTLLSAVLAMIFIARRKTNSGSD